MKKQIQPQPDKATAVLFHCCSCGLDSVNSMNCSHCGTVIAEPKRDKMARPIESILHRFENDGTYKVCLSSADEINAALNEHAALCAVAEASKELRRIHGLTDWEAGSKGDNASTAFDNAIANLAAVRK